MVLLSHEGRLSDVIHLIFKNQKILHNVRKQTQIINPSSGQYLELDICIPNLNISFEFQDTYHYGTSWYSQLPLSTVQNKDNTKQEKVRQQEMTLIPVPFWWDASAQSLKQTISFYRPDLFHDDNSDHIIPLLPPFEQNTTEGVPEIGELMLASFPSTIPDYSNWWMGEKYDGVRFCLNNNFKELYTRNGVELNLPNKFYDWLPEIFIDGEIWMGRGCFTETQKIIFSPMSLDLCFIRFVCFDNANPSFNLLPFEIRYRSILDSIMFSHPFLIVVPRVRCESNQHLTNYLQNIIDNGGEGIMIRLPNSLYEHGRSKSLVKLKAYRGDKEALVVEKENGSATLQLPDGSQFQTPTTLNLYPGDVVTFLYDNYTQGSLPVHPKIIRVRLDVSWLDIIRDFDNKMVHTLDLNATSKRAFGNAYLDDQPKTLDFRMDPAKRRNYFEKFAKTKGFDPLIPHNWYSQNLSEDQIKWSVLKPYRYLLPKALIHLFPEIGLVERKFIYNSLYHSRERKTDQTVIEKEPKQKPILKKEQKPSNTKKYELAHRRGYWAVNSSANVRHFFDTFANERKLNPLKASTWYHVPLSDIIAAGGGGIRWSLSQSFYSAIFSAYPEIGELANKIHSENHARSEKHLLFLCAQYEKENFERIKL